MTVTQLPFTEPSEKAAAVQQGPYRAESTFHANWVSESGERMCSSCYSIGARRLIGGRALCEFCASRGEGGKKR